MVYFTFSYKHEEYKILCKEILYFESNARKVTIYTQNGEHYTFNGKLSEIEQKMSDGKIPFLRVHQSYLVNYYLIRSRTKIEITLVNGKKLPISCLLYTSLRISRKRTVIRDPSNCPRSMSCTGRITAVVPFPRRSGKHRSQMRNCVLRDEEF